MSKQSVEWEKMKLKIKRFRDEHYRDGMLRAAELVAAFPCYGTDAFEHSQKLRRVGAMIRREADRRKG